MKLKEFLCNGSRDSDFAKESWQKVFQPRLEECSQRSGVADDNHESVAGCVLGHKPLIASRSWCASSAL
jgi:hypothetical protein